MNEGERRLAQYYLGALQREDSDRFIRSRIEQISKIWDAAEADDELCLQFLWAFGPYVHRSLSPEEYLRRAERALSAARSLGLHQSECVILNNIGLELHKLGRLNEAEQTFKEVLTLAGDREDYDQVGATLHNLAALHMDQGCVPEAEALFGEALALKRQSGDDPWVATTLTVLASLIAESGRLDEARLMIGEAWAIAERLGDEERLTKLERALGDMAYDLGEHEAHRRHWICALRRARTHRLSNETAVCSDNYGVLLQHRGRFERAIRFHRLAADHWESRGLYGNLLPSLDNLANAYMHIGELSLAEELFRRSIELAIMLQDQTAEAQASAELALVVAELGRPEEARETARLALNLLPGHEPGRRATALNNLAIIEDKHFRDSRGAIGHYLEAKKLHEALGGHTGRIRLLRNLARCYAGAGDHTSAVATAHEAIETAQDRRDPDVADCIALVNELTAFK